MRADYSRWAGSIKVISAIMEDYKLINELYYYISAI
jgi:hypothetical protein